MNNVYQAKGETGRQVRHLVDPLSNNERNTLCARISPVLTIVLLGPMEDAAQLLKYFNTTKDAGAEVGKGLLIFTRQFLEYFLMITLLCVLLPLLSICC